MRLKPEIIQFIREQARQLFPGVRIYLFGSRLSDRTKGGDIDICLLSEERIDKKQLRIFRREFYKRFGWQKIDLVNFTHTDQSAFKQLIMSEAEPL